MVMHPVLFSNYGVFQGIWDVILEEKGDIAICDGFFRPFGMSGCV
jgi:hypothetical protein